MGLIKCPECGKEISDKSEICVNCGFPIKNFLVEDENSDKEQVVRSEICNSSNNPKEESEQNVVFCRVCGEKNNADDNYCKSCASRLYKSNFEMAFDDIGNKDKKDSAMSIVSFILSIFGCMCYIGLIFAIIDLIAGKRERKHRFSIIAILLCIAWTIIFIFIGNNASDETYSEPATQVEYEAETETELKNVTEETEKTKNDEESKNSVFENNESKEKASASTEKKEKPKKQNKFVKALVKDGLDEKVAKKAYKILKKKIGFKKLKYVDRMDGLTNYNIEADGNDIVMTASDKVYRVFIPDSSYVFYEDGKVKLTAKELADKEIDYNDAIAYYTIAKTIVTENLKSPRSAHFPSFITGSGDVGMSKNGDLIIVQSYVDAENAFGASLRTKWTVQFRVVDLDSFSYETTYIKIGDQSYGSIEK